MENKFKVGDKVRVINPEIRHFGTISIVTGVIPGFNHPIRVLIGGDDDFPFKENELELVQESLQYDVTKSLPRIKIADGVFESAIKMKTVPPELMNAVKEAEKIYNTDIKIKQQYFPKFSELIGNQFKHGGDKYKLDGFEGMEATDLICKLWETPGEDELKWIMKTCMKYMFRFQNFHREKDLLKIATYMFIAWLKIGGHLKAEHDEDTKK
jgi:hypothetical protein